VSISFEIRTTNATKRLGRIRFPFHCRDRMMRHRFLITMNSNHVNDLNKPLREVVGVVTVSGASHTEREFDERTSSRRKRGRSNLWRGVRE